MKTAFLDIFSWTGVFQKLSFQKPETQFTCVQKARTYYKALF